MGVLVKRTYLQASSVNLATDLARYGTTRSGAASTTAAKRSASRSARSTPETTASSCRRTAGCRCRSSAPSACAHPHGRARRPRVRPAVVRLPRSIPARADDRQGVVDGPSPDAHVTTAGGTTTEERELTEPPVLSLNLAAGWPAPASSPARGTSGRCSIRPRCATRPWCSTSASARSCRQRRRIPAFRVDMAFAGLHTRRGSPTPERLSGRRARGPDDGARERAERAGDGGGLAASRRDLLEAAAVVPVMKQRIDEPRDVRRLRLRLDGANLSGRERRTSCRAPARRSQATSSRCAIRSRSVPGRPTPTRALPGARAVHRERRPGSCRRGRSARSAASPARARAPSG